MIQLNPEVTREEITFSSADESSTIHTLIWWPSGDARENPRGVVQVVHGMAEHVSRYDEFARFLATNGFVVAGDDHIGHGSSSLPERWGVLPAKNGADILVKDEGRLRTIMTAKVPNMTPYFFFGHSLGSYMTRVYISRYGHGLSGAILSGTGTVDPATSKVGYALARAIAAIRGDDYKSTFLDSMGVGAYAKAFEDEGQFAWLSVNKQNVAAYEADEACGFMFSAGGYASVCALTAEACSKSCAEQVPHGMPLLFVSGSEDPVGDMGKGVRSAAQLAQDAGQTDVRMHLYGGLRHEILNEAPEAREQVYNDIRSWLFEMTPMSNGSAA